MLHSPGESHRIIKTRGRRFELIHSEFSSDIPKLSHIETTSNNKA